MIRIAAADAKRYDQPWGSSMTNSSLPYRAAMSDGRRANRHISFLIRTNNVAGDCRRRYRHKTCPRRTADGCKSSETRVRFLFVHQNAPGQFKHLAPSLAADPAHDVVFVGQQRPRDGG